MQLVVVILYQIIINQMLRGVEAREKVVDHPHHIYQLVESEALAAAGMVAVESVKCKSAYVASFFGGYVTLSNHSLKCLDYC